MCRYLRLSLGTQNKARNNIQSEKIIMRIFASLHLTSSEVCISDKRRGATLKKNKKQQTTMGDSQSTPVTFLLKEDNRIATTNRYGRIVAYLCRVEKSNIRFEKEKETLFVLDNFGISAKENQLIAGSKENVLYGFVHFLASLQRQQENTKAYTCQDIHVTTNNEGQKMFELSGADADVQIIVEHTNVRCEEITYKDMDIYTISFEQEDDCIEAWFHSKDLRDFYYEKIITEI